ncbi:MAG TPA: acetyltransferase [Flavobacterium sp.]|uniref:acetyltransferase n=1 Tax=Flavobacterium sp. TaxID=239 RepID=UPI002BA36DB0|nr:acetyltransferase [Flavobacterium sp.]HSD14820.1 acetyltransferase [Flavobacterium sp.]
MYLYGASGHSKVIIDILKANDVEIRAVFDDAPSVALICDIPVVIPSEEDFKTQDSLIISIGNNLVRKKIAERLKANFSNAIHPTAFVSTQAEIGPGTVIMPNAVVNTFSVIGKHCIVNSGAVIEHDCVIGDYVHVSPNAALAGGVVLEEGCHVGIGAVVIQGIKIGKWATIGAGAVIVNDVPDYAVVVGNPGKIIKHNSPV